MEEGMAKQSELETKMQPKLLDFNSRVILSDDDQSPSKQAEGTHSDMY